MKKELIVKLRKTFEEAAFDYQGVECWSARELQSLLNYKEWRNFENVINKAKDSCKTAKQDINDRINQAVERCFLMKK